MDKISFETFRDIGCYEIGNLTQPEPSCFNSFISVEKYKITIEKIEEPKEIVCARIQKLWEECDNHHNCTCIEAKAKEYNYILEGNAGSKREQ